MAKCGERAFRGTASAGVLRERAINPVTAMVVVGTGALALLAAWPFIINARNYPRQVRQTLRQALLKERHQERPDLAIELYRKAWQQAEEVGMDLAGAPATGILIALGALLEKQGQQRAAVDAYEEAFAAILHARAKNTMEPDDDTMPKPHALSAEHTAWNTLSDGQRQRLLGLGQKLGDLCAELGEDERAERYYVWSVMQVVAAGRQLKAQKQSTPTAQDDLPLPHWASGADFAACLDALARFYTSRNRHVHAIPVLRLALRHLPQDDCHASMVLCHLADAYVAIGDLAQARAQVDRGLQIARSGRLGACQDARGALLFNRALVLEVGARTQSHGEYAVY
ncbi:hypothetical protein THASP1DRAFT_27240 [Thamnocephalis sphaerospora]|uniref:Tetratricopeptide repeat protein n=1 Tax=Thamnocephalis sphaerospora TaxID=78915 RepID=A0A4P9XXA3_9FUNG|nr:hypothetical protein THASP1DRAFT_27240 [Thamnocephalis sphaerospora]|eukprot:RKP10995.1 hypothetical protein THASP1DRAFT_27240 [Thamnocephalis sphaerospora]